MEHGARRVRLLFIISIIFTIIFFQNNVVYADESRLPSIELINLSQEDAERRYLNVVPRRVGQDIMKNIPLQQILVSDNWIAVGNDEMVIGVFSLTGEFKYSIAFSAEGLYRLYYNVENDGLIIFIGQNNNYYTYNSFGELIQMEGLDLERGGYEKYKPDNVDAEGNRYYLSTGNKLLDFISRAYPKIIKESPNGDKEVLWNCGYKWFQLRYSFMFIVLGILFIIAKRSITISKSKTS